MPQQLWEGKDRGQGGGQVARRGGGNWPPASPEAQLLAGGLVCATPKQAWCPCHPTFPPPPPSARLQERAIATCPSQNLPGEPRAPAACLAPCWPGQPSLCPGGHGWAPRREVASEISAQARHPTPLCLPSVLTRLGPLHGAFLAGHPPAGRRGVPVRGRFGGAERLKRPRRPQGGHVSVHRTEAKQGS